MPRAMPEAGKLRLLEEGDECGEVDDEILGLGLPALDEALED